MGQLVERLVVFGLSDVVGDHFSSFFDFARFFHSVICLNIAKMQSLAVVIMM